MEDILRQLRENPDRLPVVTLPPSTSRLAAESSLSPNRSEGYAPAVSSSAPPMEPTSSTGAVPGPAGQQFSPPFHSRSTSLDGDVCPPPPSHPSAPLHPVEFPPVVPHSAAPSMTPLNMASIPLPALTVDAATPPITGGILNSGPPQFPSAPAHPLVEQQPQLPPPPLLPSGDATKPTTSTTTTTNEPTNEPNGSTTTDEPPRVTNHHITLTLVLNVYVTGLPACCPASSSSRSPELVKFFSDDFFGGLVSFAGRTFTSGRSFV